MAQRLTHKFHTIISMPNKVIEIHIYIMICTWTWAWTWTWTYTTTSSVQVAKIQTNSQHFNSKPQKVGKNMKWNCSFNGCCRYCCCCCCLTLLLLLLHSYSHQPNVSYFRKLVWLVFCQFLTKQHQKLPLWRQYYFQNQISFYNH